MTVPMPAPGRREADQVARERALGEVSDVMLNLDHTLDRAKRARSRVIKDPEAHNVKLALDDLIRELERARKRMVQDTYYADDTLRLI